MRRGRLPRHGPDPGDARPAHPLGSRVVRALQRVLAAPARDDGHASRPHRRRLPTLPLGRADGDDRRLPRDAPGADRRRAASGARREALRRPVVHPDGRVPHVRRIAHPQPRTRAGPRSRARAGTGGRLHARSVRTRGADAADPPAGRRGARGGVARCAVRGGSRRVLVGVPRRQPRAHRVHGVRVLQRRVVRQDVGCRRSGGGADTRRRATAAVHGDRPGARHGRVRPRRAGSRPGRAPRRCRSPARWHRPCRRRPRRPPRCAACLGGSAHVAG